jgi:hypothetical protein
VVLQRLPARQLRHPEDVLLGVVVADLQLDGNLKLVLFIRFVITGVEIIVMFRIFELCEQLLTADVEGIRDILDEEQAEDGVLGLGRIKSGAQLISSGPELFFSRSCKNFWADIMTP